MPSVKVGPLADGEVPSVQLDWRQLRKHYKEKECLAKVARTSASIDSFACGTGMPNGDHRCQIDGMLDKDSTTELFQDKNGNLAPDVTDLVANLGNIQTELDHGRGFVATWALYKDAKCTIRILLQVVVAVEASTKLWLTINIDVLTFQVDHACGCDLKLVTTMLDTSLDCHDGMKCAFKSFRAAHVSMFEHTKQPAIQESICCRCSCYIDCLTSSEWPNASRLVYTLKTARVLLIGDKKDLLVRQIDQAASLIKGEFNDLQLWNPLKGYICVSPGGFITKIANSAIGKSHEAKIDNLWLENTRSDDTIAGADDIIGALGSNKIGRSSGELNAF